MCRAARIGASRRLRSDGSEGATRRPRREGEPMSLWSASIDTLPLPTRMANVAARMGLTHRRVSARRSSSVPGGRRHRSRTTSVIRGGWTFNYVQLQAPGVGRHTYCSETRREDAQPTDARRRSPHRTSWGAADRSSRRGSAVAIDRHGVRFVLVGAVGTGYPLDVSFLPRNAHRELLFRQVMVLGPCVDRGSNRGAPESALVPRRNEPRHA